MIDAMRKLVVTAVAVELVRTRTTDKVIGSTSTFFFVFATS